MAKLAVVNLTRKGYSGGYLKYLSEMLPRLLLSDRFSSIGLFSLQPTAGAPPDVCGATVAVELSRRSLSRAITAWASDIVFVPGARLLPALPVPQVVMLRNMEPHDFPLLANPPEEAFRNLLRRSAAYHACKRASGVIAVSEHVRTLLEQKWNIPEWKLQLIYHGADGNRPEPEGASLPSLPSPLLFTAGSLRPARGLEDAILALASLTKQGHRAHLAIAGGAERNMVPYSQSLKQLAIENNVDHLIFWLGVLSAAQMQHLYSQSAVFLMTTRTEACPNLALEAIAAGCPSVVTDIPPLREVFRQTALYYQPRHPLALADKIARLLHTPSPQLYHFGKDTRGRSACFRWDIAAERTGAFLIAKASS